jgi:hypothetical protein
MVLAIGFNLVFRDVLTFLGSACFRDFTVFTLALLGLKGGICPGFAGRGLIAAGTTILGRFFATVAVVGVELALTRISFVPA